jgi:hypothetical protein
MTNEVSSEMVVASDHGARISLVPGRLASRELELDLNAFVIRGGDSR